VRHAWTSGQRFSGRSTGWPRSWAPCRGRTSTPTSWPRAAGRFDEPRRLRSFYFGDASERHIAHFVHQYATDRAYRAEVDAGTTTWAVRDALFERNAHALVDSPAGLAASGRRGGWAALAETWWRWIGAHAAAIAALPEYRRLQQLDTAQDPHATELDPEIAASVVAWNDVPGVVTRFSCQGVSGTLAYEGRRLLVPSYHEPLAYIQFARHHEPVASLVEELAPAYPDVALSWGVGTDPRCIHRLLSVGSDHHVGFRAASAQLASAVLARVRADRG